MNREENRYMDQNRIDNHPEPKDKEPLFVNEPWLIDSSMFKYWEWKREPDAEEDNVRVYLPLDLNRESILRRLKSIINHYEWSTEENESEFGSDVDILIEQIRIYDQFCCQQTKKEDGKHSEKATSLVIEVIKLLDSIPDGCAELFPWRTIDKLKDEFGVENENGYWE